MDLPKQTTNQPQVAPKVKGDGTPTPSPKVNVSDPPLPTPPPKAA